ncbi:hypothetical protein LVJ94_43520 [Pendulispora rubella]|uniref:Ricin B lectin domain-containing protein n=1 Tax=Pendulispora rubella TaxID=2741070 RepID=A0ABZ2L1B3_9BACT
MQSNLEAKYGQQALAWHNVSTGAVSLWLLNDQNPSQVEGTMDLNWTCGPACQNEWKVIDTAPPADGVTNILWHNKVSGDVSQWNIARDGSVTASGPLDWQCSAATGCSQGWRPLGRMETSRPCSPTPCVTHRYENLVWHNAQSGEVSAWLLGGGNTVLEAQPFSFGCAAATGCSQAWRAVGPLGRYGLLWHNASTGDLSVWKTGHNNEVTGTQNLSWTCGPDCAQQWKTIGQVEFDGKGGIDLGWHNIVTGEVAIWQLDTAGTVTGTSTLSFKCDSTCSQTWKPIGFLRFPGAPPH